MNATKISLKDVEYIARLARLRLEEEEKVLFGEQLNHILEYMEKLNQLDTTNVSPTAHVLSLSNVFREDQALPSLPRDAALEAAPDKVNGYFRVPKIIE